MGFIQDNILLVVGVLSALVFLEGLIIYVQYRRTSLKFKLLDIDYKKKEKECEELNKQNAKVQEADERYGTTRTENAKLKHTIDDLNQTINNLKENITSLELQVRDLKRDNDELNKLLEEPPDDNAPTETSQPPAQETISSEVVQEPNEKSKEDLKLDSATEPKAESPKEKVMYASFPRSAADNIYFSDLSENRADDTYFELKVDVASDKASFKPLDFMKIRNYDPAMAAMLTEGVKPNVASTVLGIEPGKAHKEGKDWIIDNPAKIKLA